MLLRGIYLFRTVVGVKKKPPITVCARFGGQCFVVLVKEKKIGRKIDSVPDPDNGRVLCTDGIRTAPNVYIYIYICVYRMLNIVLTYLFLIFFLRYDPIRLGRITVTKNPGPAPDPSY